MYFIAWMIDNQLPRARYFFPENALSWFYR